MTPEPTAVACACEPDISEPSPLCPVHGIEGWRDEPTAATAWYLACAVMFAAVPTGIVLLRLHELTAGFVAIGIGGALECFFFGWFVGRSSRV